MSNTIIELRHSYVTGNVPSSLANGEIAINTYDGKLFYRGGPSNTIQTIERYQGPAGLNQEIQFNDSGVLGSSANLTFNKLTGLFRAGNVTANTVTTRDYIQFGDGTRQYTANAGSGSGSGTTINVYNANTQVFTETANGTGTTFNLGFVPASQNNIIVSSNGVVQYDYTLSSSTLIFNFTPPAGALIRVQTFGTSQANSLSGVFANGNLIIYDGNTLVSLANTNAAGTYGNSTYIPVITTDNYGRIVSVVNTAITGLNASDQYARDTSNASFIAANSAGSYANSAFIHANAAFNKANTGGALTVSLTDDSNNFTNVVTSVTGIRFDANSGFDITNLGSGNVKVGMNSTFKTWKITGQQDLIANGLDTIEFVGSNGVVLTSNTLASPKTITFDTSSVFNKANAAFTVANNANTVYVSDSPPSSPVANTLWWQSNTATLKIYYNDGITSQWVDAIQTYALDTIARNTGNAAFIAANSAGSYANSAFIHANAAFNAANSAADTWVRNQANAAFEAANSAAIYANGAFIAANSAGSYANSAFAVANNEVGVNFYQNTTIEAAFSHANSAFNTANNEAGVNATQNNTITAAFITANSADVYANGAFNRANNSINANTGGSITGDLFISGNLTVTGETTYTNTSTLLVNDNIITVNNGINQSGQPLINAGLEVNRGAQPNSSILWIETSGKWAANNGNTQYFLASDAAESYANAAFLVANTTDDKATSAGIYANGAFQSANSAGVYANSAYVHANAGFVIANDAFFFANVGIQDANTAHNKANAAFIRANASFTIANGTIAWNTANAAFLAANNEAGVNATQNTNISFAWNHANAAFLQANTGGSGVKIDVYNANTNVFTGTANGTGTTFALGFTPNSSNNIIVSANGVVQYDYSLAGSTLILNFTPTIGTLIRVQSFGSSQANSLNGIFQTGNLIVYDGNTLVSLANTNTPGTYGNSTHIPVITTDSYGRITGVVNTTIGISGEDQYARNTANAAFNAANNEAGVNATQNTNISFAWNHANSAFDSANTKTYTYVQSVVPATANVAGALWQNTSSGIVYMNFGNTSNPVWAEL